METLLIIGILVLIAWVAGVQIKKWRRKQFLIRKYRSEAVAEAIMGQKVWQGMSSEQLIDALGRPVDIDETIYKTKRKEVWKYGQTGKNRYRQRVTLENGEVVGWHNQ